MTYKKLLAKKFLTCAGAAIALPVLSVQAQTDDIVVTGLRLPAPPTETGSSVSVITAEEIEQSGYRFVGDVLARAPGVTVNQNGAFGGVAQIRIRGNASEQTLVLIDGVPVNDAASPGGGFDFSRVDTGDIARIEVLKGPQSTLWGTDAIGGVVNIITKRPEPGKAANLFAEAGSFNTFRTGGALSGADERGDFRVAVTNVTSDGISKADENNGNTEEDGYEALTLSGRGGLNLSESARLEATLRYVDADTEFDGSVFDPVTSSFVLQDTDEKTLSEELSGTVSLTASAFDGRLENHLLAGYSELERENFTNGVAGFSAKGERLVLRYQGTLQIDARQRTAFGAEREETETGDGDVSIDSLFALYEVKLAEALTLTAGLRHDDHETFGGETTARAAAAWQATEMLTARASWGQGFKAPTIFQSTFFCCGATEPNADLAPETSEAFDAGFDWRFAEGRGSLSLTYFDQETENLIIFSPAGDYQNIDLAETRGVEIALDYALTPALSVSADYTYTQAEDGTGADLIRVPDHAGDVALNYDPQGPFSGTVSVRYNGEEADSGGSVDAWTRVDLAGAWEINERVELYGRVENLFDEEYQQIIGYGTPDLSGYVGIRASF